MPPRPPHSPFGREIAREERRPERSDSGFRLFHVYRRKTNRRAERGATGFRVHFTAFAGVNINAGLKDALAFRVYARINVQSVEDDGTDAFIFRMNECRVQAARKSKQLPDYPCKSAGLVEYAYFARAIDPRIQTECLGCPPDAHPDDWYCAWRFSLK